MIVEVGLKSAGKASYLSRRTCRETTLRCIFEASRYWGITFSLLPGTVKTDCDLTNSEIWHNDTCRSELEAYPREQGADFWLGLNGVKRSTIAEDVGVQPGYPRAPGGPVVRRASWEMAMELRALMEESDW